jgi:hypothetical protein
MTPTFFTAIVVLAGMLGKGAQPIYWQLVLCLFGGGAAAILTAIGGATITPAVGFLPFLMYRAWNERERFYGEPFRMAKPSFYMLLLACWAVISACILPRLLAGEVDIVPVDRTVLTTSLTVPLRPVSGNLTQSGYALGSAFAFMAFRALLRKPGRIRAFGQAILLVTALNFTAAIINLVEFYAGIPSILAFVRNGNYTQFNNDVSSGLVRIQGTFYETSMFATFTIPLFAFCSSWWLSDRKARIPGLLALLSLLLLLLSTSGTAYIGLALYLSLLGVRMLWQAYGSGFLPRLPTLVMSGGALVLLIGGAFVLELPITERVIDFFEYTIAGKMSSESGQVRAAWNLQAWRNFVETGGLGVGMGSARASSFVMVVLSNLGAPGAILFSAFLYKVLTGPSRLPAEDALIPRAAREATLAGLIAAAMATTVFDLGVAFYGFAAACTVIPLPDEQPVYRVRPESVRAWV